jgi:hypothetical protein
MGVMAEEDDPLSIVFRGLRLAPGNAVAPLDRPRDPGCDGCNNFPTFHWVAVPCGDLFL